MKTWLDFEKQERQKEVAETDLYEKDKEVQKINGMIKTVGCGGCYALSFERKK